MFRSMSIMSRPLTAMLFLAFCMFPLAQTAFAAESDSSSNPQYSPVVNGQALRGLSTVTSAESMGAGRLTFGVLVPWYEQNKGYATSPDSGTEVFTTTGAFSYGVNSNVDIFGSVTGYGMSNNHKSGRNSGWGTVRAGVQGSLPFPEYAFLRIGGQAVIIGGTAQNQINTYRADGYNYFDTRTGYDVMGKLMQSFIFGSEDFGFKFHANEAGVLGLNKSSPALLLLGAGVQANLYWAALGAEINSRTRFNNMAFGTDPLWFTPTIHVRTVYDVNVMAGIDLSLSADRSDNNPRALEPYRVFGSVAFSFDMLKDKKHAALLQQQKTAQEKADMENKSAQSAQQIHVLSMKSFDDSVKLANEKKNGKTAIDSMQNKADYDAKVNKDAADAMAKKSTADSLALIASANNLAIEKEKRSDAEKQLLSTGELLLDAVYFKTGLTVISINSKPYLNIIGKMLLKYPKLQIEIAGHTDNVGSVEYNVNLSQGRAEAVRSYLVEIAPALNSNLNSHGYGMSMPKADNATKEGRLSNRRVELRVINKDALQQYSQN